jgi:hypothetical protein
MTAAIEFQVKAPTRFLDVRGQRAGFVLLAAFLVSFLFIRTSARMNRSDRFSWWPGSVKTGSGLHLHHLVWRIAPISDTRGTKMPITPSIGLPL